MIEEKIKNTLLSAAAIDKINNEDKEYRSYKVQLMVSVIKSLIPSNKAGSVEMNFNRLKSEIELLKDYYTLNPLEIIDLETKDYWNLKPNNLKSLLIPLVLANEEFENTREEIIKTTLLLTGNIHSLIENILLGKLLDSVVTKEINLENIISDLKEEVIHFSQENYLKKHGHYYKRPIKEYKGNFTIDFEKEKIHYINLLNKKLFLNEDLLVRTLIILDGNKDIAIDELFLSAVYGIANKEVETLVYNNKKFIERIADYLIKLRKGRINPKELQLQNTTVPDMFSFKIGDIINHPLLNKSKLIKRYMKNNKEVIELITKSGLYKFQK